MAGHLRLVDDDTPAVTPEGLGTHADGLWNLSAESVMACAEAVAMAHRHFMVQKGQRNDAWIAWCDDRAFGRRTAERLVTIGNSEVLHNLRRTASEALPQSWYTLYLMADLSDETVDDGLATGTIRSDMTREGAIALRIKDGLSDPTPSTPGRGAMVAVLEQALTALEAALQGDSSWASKAIEAERIVRQMLRDLRGE